MPDTAKAAADAMAFELGLPCVEGLMRNRYLGRTFIEGTADRATKVRLKYTPLPEVLQGKRVLLVASDLQRPNAVTQLSVVAERAGVHVWAPEPDNGERWALMAPLLLDRSLRPTATDVALARDAALDLLRLRRDLPLLRLGTARRVLDKVGFPVSGTADGRADVVVMLVDDDAGEERVDPARSGVLVVLNASTDPVTQPVPVLRGQEWELAAVQRDGADPVVRATTWDAQAAVVTVPGLTAAVLVRPRPAQPPRPTGSAQV